MNRRHLLKAAAACLAVPFGIFGNRRLQKRIDDWNSSVPLCVEAHNASSRRLEAHRVVRYELYRGRVEIYGYAGSGLLGKHSGVTEAAIEPGETGPLCVAGITKVTCTPATQGIA